MTPRPAPERTVTAPVQYTVRITATFTLTAGEHIADALYDAQRVLSEALARADQSRMTQLDFPEVTVSRRRS